MAQTTGQYLMRFLIDYMMGNYTYADLEKYFDPESLPTMEFYLKDDIEINPDNMSALEYIVYCYEQEWDICMDPLEGAREFCENVKKAGLRIYVLSNASDLFYTYFPKFLPLDFFDGVFVSSDYLMLKPDLEIYETFLTKYALKAEECLFVDDRQENADGAAKAGMNTFCFKGDYGKVIDRISELNQ